MLHKISALASYKSPEKHQKNLLDSSDEEPIEKLGPVPTKYTKTIEKYSDLHIDEFFWVK